MTAMQTALKAPAAPAFDVERIRADFPILKLEIGGKPLVYLDNAASSQMPQPVIDRLVRYQTTQHANVNRGVHYLSETATSAYEEARGKVQRFMNAREDREVIFTSGTTDAINLVMHGYGRGRCWRKRRARRFAWCRSTTPVSCWSTSTRSSSTGTRSSSA
jgi:cysteine desulfurase/selenocysteine lyase